MFEYLYEWTQNIAFYLILTTAVFHALPATSYKKYIRFFTGMILILMIMTPVFRLMGKESQVTNFYKSREYEKKIEEIENAAKRLENVNGTQSLNNVGSQEEEHAIGVDEIQIER